MLCSLHIENIAVIRTADIDFSSGFTVLTGETGAGKSIIIDSIGLVMGGKPSRDLIRSGEESASVSAVFGELDDECVKRLAAVGLAPDEDGLLMVQRTITASGKAAARVNGRVIPVSLVREAMKSLIAVHGQHDNMMLLAPENHIRLLDEFAGLSAELAAYETSYDRYCELNRRIAELSRGEREKAQRTEFLRYQIDEIESAKLKPEEEELLMKRRARLQNAEKVNQLVGTVYGALYRNDKGTAAADKLRRAIRALDALASVVPDAEELSVRLDAMTYELEDIALTVQTYLDEPDADPTAALDKLETRLDGIAKLERKYGDTVPDVLAFLARAKEELNGIETSEETLNDCIFERDQLLPIMAAQADELSERRNEAAAALEAKLEAELAYLDMSGVRFRTGMKRRVENDGGAEYARSGADNVEFLIAANKGEEARPLSRIASGGELARIMLAMKSVLADREAPGTMIFDEVDAGVSGKTSEKLGIKLRSLTAGGSAQVLCVTHSAQIAALADTHLKISKSEKNGRTETSVLPLDHDGRVGELSRIMGGITITDTIRRSAEEMLAHRVEAPGLT